MVEMFRVFLFLAALCACLFLPIAHAQEDARYAEAYEVLQFDTTTEVTPEAAAHGLSLLNQLAGENHANALNTLGIIYLHGLFGMESDDALAISYYERAFEAAEGDLRSAAGYNLASTLSQIAEYGTDDWLRIEKLATELVDDPIFGANARGLVGKAMLLGPGEDRYADALPFLLAGVSENGDDMSLHWLIARGYNSGWFGSVDRAAACRHFLEASEAGIDDADWQVGMCHLKGDGLAKDSSQAYKWFVRSADAGFQSGMISSAVMLATGDGTPPNTVAAANWYTAAVFEGGDETYHAMRGLGAMHVVGELGSLSDLAVGVALLELADEGGDPIASKILKAYKAEVDAVDRGRVESIKADPLASLKR